MPRAVIQNAPKRPERSVRLCQQAFKDQLLDKQFHLVEILAADLVELLATAGNEIGTVNSKPRVGNREVVIAMLGGINPAPMVQGAPIEEGAEVMSEIGGTVVTSTSETRSLGRKASAGPGVAGDVIKVSIF